MKGKKEWHAVMERNKNLRGKRAALTDEETAYVTGVQCSAFVDSDYYIDQEIYE